MERTFFPNSLKGHNLFSFLYSSLGFVINWKETHPQRDKAAQVSDTESLTGMFSKTVSFFKITIDKTIFVIPRTPPHVWCVLKTYCFNTVFFYFFHLLMKYFKAFHKSFYISGCYLLGGQDLIKNNHTAFLQQQFLNNISYLGHNSKFYDYLGKKDILQIACLNQDFNKVHILCWVSLHIVLGLLTSAIPSTGGPVEFLAFCIWLIACFYIVYLFSYLPFSPQSS